MSTAEIIKIVEEELKIEVANNDLPTRNYILDAKRVAIVMLFEEGLAPRKIAKSLNRNLGLVYKDLYVIDKLLSHDKGFKCKYLACIKRLADMEEAA